MRVHWRSSVQAALEEARTAKRPVLLDFSAAQA